MLTSHLFSVKRLYQKTHTTCSTDPKAELLFAHYKFTAFSKSRTDSTNSTDKHRESEITGDAFREKRGYFKFRCLVIESLRVDDTGFY